MKKKNEIFFIFFYLGALRWFVLDWGGWSWKAGQFRLDNTIFLNILGNNLDNILFGEEI